MKQNSRQSCQGFAVALMVMILSTLAVAGAAQPGADQGPLPPWAQPGQGPQIEITCKFVEVVPGAFPAKEVLTTKSVAAWLAKPASEGKATVMHWPHVICPNNQWAEVSFYATMWWGGTTEYDQHGQPTSETEQMEVEKSLRVKPVLLEDGKIAIDLKIILTNVAGIVTGPEGEVMPIMVTQETRTSVTVPDRQTVTIRCGRVWKFVRPSPAETEAGVEGEPREMLITITPRVIKPEPQTPSKPEAAEEADKTE